MRQADSLPERGFRFHPLLQSTMRKSKRISKDIIATEGTSAYTDTSSPSTKVTQSPTRPRSKLGIPEWLLHPEKIPAQILENSIPLEETQLHLSAEIRARCEAYGAKKLFPVQVAVMEALLGRYQATTEHEVPRKKKRKSTPSSSSSSSPTSSPWEFRYRFASVHPGDLCVSAPTGSGKTLGYVIPLVEMLRFRVRPCLRALILVPTRDLVRQVKETVDHFIEGTDLKVVAISGGMQKQQRRDTTPSHKTSVQRGFLREQALLVDAGEPWTRGGSTACDILITTPGRLVDHLNFTPGFTLQHLRWLILDEADRLLNQSFDDWLPKTVASVKLPTGPESHSLTHPFELVMGDGSSGVVSGATHHGLVSYREEPIILDAQDPSFDPVLRLRPLAHGPTHLQKFLFSATLTRNPEKIASLELVKPRYIAAVAADGSIQKEDSNMPMAEGVPTAELTTSGKRYIVPASLEQRYCVCGELSEKPLFLLLLLYRYRLTSTLCFTKSIISAERLCSIVKEFAEKNPLQGEFHGYCPTLCSFP